MDENQVNKIRKLLSEAGINVVPDWIAQASINKDPHLQLGVALSRGMTLGDIADFGES